MTASPQTIRIEPGFDTVSVSWLPVPHRSGLGFSRSVKANLGLLHGSKSLNDDAVNKGKKRLDFLLGIDNFDHDREIAGQAEDLRRVEPTVCTKALKSTEYRGPGQALLSCLAYDPFVKRHPFVLVTLPDENAQ